MRKVTALGLALGAVFALSATIASSASATAFTAADLNPQHLTTEDVGAEDLTTVGGNELSCTLDTLTAEAEAGQSTTLEFMPSFVNCKTVGASFNNVTKTINICSFTFTSHGHIKLDCPANSKIEVHHYANQAHTSASCTSTIVEQNLVGTVSYASEGGKIIATGAPSFTVLTHGSCSFGFTLNQESTWHLSFRVKTKSGTAIHVKT